MFKGLETSCVRNRGEGSVYNHLLQTNGSGVRGVDPRMSMKNLNLLSIKWVVGVGACGQWVWFLFCVRRHVPLVHRELFWGEGALVVKKNRKTTSLWPPHRCKLWWKMAQELDQRVGQKERRWHKNMKIKRNTSGPTSTLALYFFFFFFFFFNPLLSGCKDFFLPF